MPLSRRMIVGAMIAATTAFSPALADVRAGVEAWQNGNYPRAVAEWKPLAEQGDPDAQFNLAQAYKLGRGVPADLKLAESWYEKAARQEHEEAQANLGLILFQNGRQEAGMVWIRKASDNGDPRARYVLATALFNGDMMAKDWPRAYALMNRAAAQGLIAATSSLTQMENVLPEADRQQGMKMARDLARLDAEQEAAGRAAPDAATPVPASPSSAGPPTQVASNNTPPAVASSSMPAPRAPTPAPEAPPPAPTPPAALPAPLAPPAQSIEVATSVPPVPQASPEPASATPSAPPPQIVEIAAAPSPAPPTSPVNAAEVATTAITPPPIEAASAPPPAPQAEPVEVALAAPPQRTALPAKPRAALSAPLTSAGGRWRVQLGAYGSVDLAKGQWAMLSRKSSALAGLKPSYEPVGSLTRLRINALTDRAAAAKVCSAAKSAGQVCLLIAP